MRVSEVQIGECYLLRTYLKPVKPAKHYNLMDKTVVDGIGFAGCWVITQVRIIERVGQHFIAEQEEWKCLSRDEETWKCIWEKVLVKKEVYARNLKPI